MLRRLMVVCGLWFSTLGWAEVTSHSPAEKVALVDLTQQYVRQHQKNAWMGSFSDAAAVKDPMDTIAFRNLSLFWDTFIEPNDVVFDIKNTVVDHNMVARYVTVQSTHRQLKGTAFAPAYLFYQIEETPSGPKFKEMRAVWDVLSSGRNLIGHSPRMAWRMFRWIHAHLGTSPAFWYFFGQLRGPCRIFAEPRLHKVTKMIFGKKQRSLSTWRKYLRDNFTLRIAGKQHTILELDSLSATGTDMKIYQVIQAGHQMAFGYSMQQGSEQVTGIGRAEFSGYKVKSLELFAPH